jgi:ADP-heptose:LPS heptosyltransferase
LKGILKPAPFIEACTAVERILILQLKRIGDFILTLPALQALRREKPEAQIVLLVPAGLLGLASCVPGVNQVVGYRSGFGSLQAFSSVLQGPWDACLDFTGTDRSAVLTRLSRANQRVGYAKFAEGKFRRHAYTKLCPASVRDLHTVDFHLALVQELAAKALLVQGETPLSLPATIAESVATKLKGHHVTKPYAIVHPGTAREEKFWEDERWADVIDYLHQDRDLSVVLTGTGQDLERPHLTLLKSLLKVPVVDLTGVLSLEEMACLVAGCEIIVGVDSMAMHLAAIFQRPQVALFGPTNPYHWQPRHARGYVVLPHEDEPRQTFSPREKKDDMKHVSTAAVIRAIAAARSS